MFAPAGVEFATPGVLTWTMERGAELELADRSHPWPIDFDETFAVHGQPYDGDAVTLLQARPIQRMGAQTAKLRSWVLAVGAHTDMDERWLFSHYCPASLHEWLHDTGLVSKRSIDGRQVTVEWNQPAHRTVTVPGGEVSLAPRLQSDVDYGPDWHLRTSTRFIAKADEPLTINAHWSQFRSPLMSFCLFAVDRPDDLTYESYYSPERRTQIVVLRSGREAPQHDWRLTSGHYLFQAEDVGDPATAVASWCKLWHQTSPALGLFGEVIQTGNIFTVPRFLTLYTAAEGYWKGTKVGKAGWSPKQLAKRANVPAAITGATKDAVSLLGASRNYHAHLDVESKFSPDEIVDETYQLTRRLHALLQACLLRELGIDTSNVERLLKQHYRSWPIL